MAVGDLKHALRAAESLCSATKSSGAVVVNADLDTMGSIEYMVYAPTMNEALNIESKFENYYSAQMKRCKTPHLFSYPISLNHYCGCCLIAIPHF